MVRYQSLTRKPELFRAPWARAPLVPSMMYPLNPPLAGPGCNHRCRQGGKVGMAPPWIFTRSLLNLPNSKILPLLVVNTGSILIGPPPLKIFVPTFFGRNRKKNIQKNTLPKCAVQF